MLAVDPVRHVVADVLVALVAHRADNVVPLVHSITAAVDIVARLWQIGAEERLPLNMRGYFEAGELENGRSKVDRTHQLVANRPGHALPFLAKLLWDTNDQRDMRA